MRYLTLFRRGLLAVLVLVGGAAWKVAAPQEKPAANQEGIMSFERLSFHVIVGLYDSSRKQGQGEATRSK